MRSVLTHALALYLGAGMFAGVMMQRAIPPLNPLGVAYIAATWPNQVRCARVSSGCNPLPPEWMEPYLWTHTREGASDE